MALFYSSVPESHDTVTVSQHVQYQDPEAEAAKWNSAIIHFIISPVLFLLWFTCQSVLCKTFCTQLKSTCPKIKNLWPIITSENLQPLKLVSWSQTNRGSGLNRSCRDRHLILDTCRVDYVKCKWHLAEITQRNLGRWHFSIEFLFLLPPSENPSSWWLMTHGLCFFHILQDFVSSWMKRVQWWKTH